MTPDETALANQKMVIQKLSPADLAEKLLARDDLFGQRAAAVITDLAAQLSQQARCSLHYQDELTKYMLAHDNGCPNDP